MFTHCKPCKEEESMKRGVLRWLLIASIALFPNFALGETDVTLPKHISIASLMTGGVTYVISVGVGNLVKKYVGIDYTVEPGRGTPVWAHLMREGQIEFALQSIYDPYCATYGIRAFAKAGKHPIRMVGAGNSTFFNVITLEKSGIKSIPDLRGKRWRADLAAGSE